MVQERNNYSIKKDFKTILSSQKYLRTSDYLHRQRSVPNCTCKFNFRWTWTHFMALERLNVKYTWKICNRASFNKILLNAQHMFYEICFCFYCLTKTFSFQNRNILRLNNLIAVIFSFFNSDSHKFTQILFMSSHQFLVFGNKSPENKFLFPANLDHAHKMIKDLFSFFELTF